MVKLGSKGCIERNVGGAATGFWELHFIGWRWLCNTRIQGGSVRVAIVLISIAWRDIGGLVQKCKTRGKRSWSFICCLSASQVQEEIVNRLFKRFEIKRRSFVFAELKASVQNFDFSDTNNWLTERQQRFIGIGRVFEIWQNQS